MIFHTLTNYCNKDAKVLKIAFFWGSLIPAIVYILWTCSILGSVHQSNPEFYNQMINGKVEVGNLIQQLSQIAHWSFVQLLVWWLSLLAIVTSIVGIGIGLNDSLSTMIPAKLENPILRKILAAVMTIGPAYIVAILIPNAFIKVLGFAGMILVIIAIILPIYLLYKAKITSLNYSELKSNFLLIISSFFGIAIILCEVMNMLL